MGGIYFERPYINGLHAFGDIEYQWAASILRNSLLMGCIYFYSPYINRYIYFERPNINGLHVFGDTVYQWVASIWDILY